VSARCVCRQNDDVEESEPSKAVAIKVLIKLQGEMRISASVRAPARPPTRFARTLPPTQPRSHVRTRSHAPTPWRRDARVTSAPRPSRAQVPRPRGPGVLSNEALQTLHFLASSSGPTVAQLAVDIARANADACNGFAAAADRAAEARRCPSGMSGTSATEEAADEEDEDEFAAGAAEAVDDDDADDDDTDDDDADDDDDDED
jgi:hypothetical protein